MQEDVAVGADVKKIIETCVQAVLTHFAITVPLEISVLLTDGARIREINRDFRKIDKETDVLSFPQFCFDTPGVLPNELLLQVEGGILTTLGDMVLNISQAERQATEYGHSLSREVGYLTVHSMLHLLGYDHMEEADKAVMRQKEEEILAYASLTREEM